MKEKVMRLLSIVVGDLKHDSLEHRLFNTMTLFNGITNIAGAFSLLYLQDYGFVFYLTIGAGFVFIVFYFFSRVKSLYRSLYWPFIMTIQTYLIANALGNAGSMGGSHYYFIPALVIATILSRSALNTIAAFAMFAATTLGMLWIETNQPGWITQYAHMEERTRDVWGNYLFVQFFTGALVLILVANLNNERRKSDQLLLNVLPESIAEELKKHDRVEPLHYDSATVLFTDFVGFTQLAERLSPQALIAKLDECFSRFDSVGHNHNMEKIKTIGDAYMCVGGVPVANHTHAVDAVLMALEIRSFMEQMKIVSEQAGLPFWELRVGIHSGPLVAGVIGEKKFAYDVWGDTVNTASRMESSGEKGRINISGATYELVRNFFSCEHRGRIAAKNKGEIDMYFVTGIKPEFTRGPGGLIPNDSFWVLYENLRKS
ncbi:MAG: adenylate/guanylate cyclase domain-containing protein [Spirochaetia bacterium]|nr:adenylate/guanylate cyclase domain-containing protein [Spirochaetia bacterium]